MALRPSEIRIILAQTPPEAVHLGAGQFDRLPIEDLTKLLCQILSADSEASVFQYGPTRGVTALLTATQALLEKAGIHSDIRQLLATQGSQQGLDLVARVLLDPGDVVLVERPTYPGALAAFHAAQAEVVGVELTNDGIDLEDLRRQHRALTEAGKRIKLLYVIPTFQNPTGITMSRETRIELLELAEKLDILILEDDPYAELYFEAPPPRSLKSQDVTDRVIYLGSFSKILAPGLRQGFIVGPSFLVERMELVKQVANSCGSKLMETLALRSIESGLLEENCASLRKRMRRRCATMLASLAREMPSSVSWTRPEGGIFLWLTLPEGVDSRGVAAEALARGVSACPGTGFYESDAPKNRLRLAFCQESGEQLESGIRILADVIVSLEAAVISKRTSP